MKFMTIVKASEKAGNPPPELYQAIMDLGEEATKAGVFVSMGGLLGTDTGARAELRKDRITMTDGPFTEAKEVIGGFAIYDVPSKKEAIEWTERFLELHRTHWKGFECEVEVRQMMEF